MSPNKETLVDHASVLTKALLNLAPYGGALASLIGDWVPSAGQRNMQKSIEIFAAKLSALDARIDVEAVNKDEFAELYGKCSAIFASTHHEEKLNAASNLLANLLLAPGDAAKVPYEELDHLVRCVDSLSIGAITALGAARHVGISSPLGGQHGHFNFGQLHKALPGLEASLLMGLISELRSLNLLHVQDPAIRMPDYENYLLELTPIGERFAERFIEGRT